MWQNTRHSIKHMRFSRFPEGEHCSLNIPVNTAENSTLQGEGTTPQ